MMNNYFRKEMKALTQQMNDKIEQMEASAEITGTSPNFVLNLTIPQGPTGPAA